MSRNFAAAGSPVSCAVRRPRILTVSGGNVTELSTGLIRINFTRCLGRVLSEVETDGSAGSPALAAAQLPMLPVCRPSKILTFRQNAHGQGPRGVVSDLGVFALGYIISETKPASNGEMKFQVDPRRD